MSQRAKVLWVIVLAVIPLVALSGFTIWQQYLRDEALLADVHEFLRERVPSQTQYVVLHADVCRSELLVEIDCLHGEA